MKAPLTQLGTLVDEVSTWNPSRNQQDKVFTYIDLGSIDQATKAITEARKISSADAPSRARQLVKVGDILVSTVRPNLNGVAKVSDGLGDATASTGFCVLRPQKDRLDSSYLFHWVRTRSFVDAMVKQATGASYPAVSDKIIFSSKLPLPPLPEQRRIAAILDKADTLRAQRRAAIAKLDELLQSVFIEMFGDPVMSPKASDFGTLGDVVETMQYGPRFHNEEYSSHGTRIVRITDLDASGVLNFDTMPKMEVTDEELTKYGLRSGDLIFARTGATVGKVALIKPSDPLCVAGAYFIRMRFKDMVLPEYVLNVLSTKSIQTLIAVKSRQAAQQNFSGPGLRELPMPVPPLDLQRRFVQIAGKIQSQKQTLQRAVEETETLFRSLQQSAFSGKL